MGCLDPRLDSTMGGGDVVYRDEDGANTTYYTRWRTPSYGMSAVITFPILIPQVRVPPADADPVHYVHDDVHLCLAAGSALVQGKTKFLAPLEKLSVPAGLEQVRLVSSRGHGRRKNGVFLCLDDGGAAEHCLIFGVHCHETYGFELLGLSAWQRLHPQRTAGHLCRLDFGPPLHSFHMPN